ncbi:type I restriction endonuclease subunit S [Streptococcus oralis subsp. oralis]|uniref:Type I restriction endonuclease subunit S n=2 Tax=Streptococcus TaxID=1301 RepID=A0A1X1HGW7_STROR|nr:restriction endonuclease subunit S [Streptococcus oralis]ORO60180.1 type I restriction endonuclease subunit S [Streptococcus oralis subsp. oralis]
MNILEEIQNCSVEWKELGEVCEIVRGNGLQKKDFLDEGIPCIHYGQIYTYYSSYVYKTKSFISFSLSEKLKKAQTGDIIVATTSENIEDVGKSIVWLGDGDVCIGGHSCILKTRENSKYINYYMQSIFFQKQKEKQVIGTKVIELYPKNLSKIKIPIPPLEIQEKIVQILDKFTDYVTELTSELTSRKKQYSYYRDKLLSFEDEVYQVEWKTLDTVSEQTNNIFWNKIGDDELFKYIDLSSVDRVTNKIIETTAITKSTAPSRAQRIVKSDDIILGTTRPTLKRFTKITDDYNNQICSTGFYIFRTNGEVLPNYVYHIFSSSDFYKYLEENQSGVSYPAISDTLVKKYKIPVPSLEIQSRIVQVLDNFDTVCNDLNIGLPKEIELRQKQYEYFREKLLTFIAEGEYTESRVEEWDNSALIKLLQWVFGSIRVELGSICEFVRGNGLQKKDFTEIGKSVIHYGQIYTKYDFTVTETLSKTSEIVFEKLKKAYPNDLVMAITSENVEDVGKAIVWEGKEEIGISGDSYIIRTNQNSRYLNYWFRSISFQSQKERKVTGTKVIRINSKDMEQFKIVLPPLTEQKRIVSILDNFNTLTNSLSEGLPKEIELRQKQYEYWRNRLLNFNE